METKAVQAATDLDTARCRGNWAAIPDLAKRYKKYHPDESVLDTVACLEAELVEQLERSRNGNNRQSFSGTDAGHQQDTPDNIYTPSPIPTEKLQTFIQRLQDITSNRNQELETPDDRQAQFAKIILSRVYYETGQYDKSLEALQNLALNINDATSGYGLVLLVQARTIKGICYEKQSNISAATDAFGAAWDIVEQHLDQKSEMLACWIEQSLYYGTLLRLRTGAPPQKTLRMMRAYTRLVGSHWPSQQWRLNKQWVIFRSYAAYLTKLSAGNVSFASSPQAAVAELCQITETMRVLFRAFSSTCTKKQISTRAIELADITVNAHDTIGWGDPVYIRQFLHFLYQAKEHTFNSPSITCYLFFTLVRVGQFDEARYAFNSYMMLSGASDFAKLLETDNVDAREISTCATVICKRLSILQESWADIRDKTIKVLLAGVTLYGNHYNDGKTAAVMAELAVEIVEQMDMEKAIQATCYHSCGIAHGIFASQCDSPDTRSDYHKRSIDCLKRATDYQDSWQSWYELALQQAVVRDLQSAASSITRSIQLKKDHLPSWHLLALIYSCNQHQDKTTEALQLLETGIEQSKVLTILGDIPSEMPVVSWTGEKTSSEYFYHAESYLELSMSQIQLLEKLEGAEAVLGLFPELFTLHSKLSSDLGLQDSPISQNGSRKPSTVSTSTEEATTATIIRKASHDRPRANSAASSPVPPRRMRSSSSDDARSDRKPATTASMSELHPNRGLNREGSKSLRKKSIHLIDVGFARRIGSNNSQGSSRKTSSSTLLEGSNTSSSLRRSSSVTTESSMLSLFAPSPSSAQVKTSLFRSSNIFINQQRERWYQLLIKLWLLSTTTFIHAGRIEEATKAVMEAEEQLLLGQLNDANVWHQLGVVCIKKANETQVEELRETGLDAFKKALAIHPDHVDTLVDMARCFIDMKEWELAENHLDRATQGYGWDHAEAWYLLGVCHRERQDMQRAKECFAYALELSETTPLQPFTLLPRFVN
ncbi:TPR-like protein [Lichtheimia hyalospora FSU 10163]|nr:TPR-like protein [Lichtheimia hyalospora FSU 10163]